MYTHTHTHYDTSPLLLHHRLLLSITMVTVYGIQLYHNNYARHSNIFLILIAVTATMQVGPEWSTCVELLLLFSSVETIYCLVEWNSKLKRVMNTQLTISS